MPCTIVGAPFGVAAYSPLQGCQCIGAPNRAPPIYPVELERDERLLRLAPRLPARPTRQEGGA